MIGSFDAFVAADDHHALADIRVPVEYSISPTTFGPSAPGRPSLHLSTHGQDDNVGSLFSIILGVASTPNLILTGNFSTSRLVQLTMLRSSAI